MTLEALLTHTKLDRAYFLQCSISHLARLYRAIESEKPLEWIESAALLREAADEAGFEPVLLLCRELEMIADRSRAHVAREKFRELSAEMERIRWEG